MNKFIRKCRENAGLTQAQLAEKMGVSVISVQNWERGKTKIEMGRIIDLAEVFNVPAETVIQEMLIEENKNRSDNWPDFLFDEQINKIIDTLHLNHAQQELFGLLYVYDANYLKKKMMDFNTLNEDLKRIPYAFIEKVGAIRFMNQVDGLHNVIKYVQSDFLIEVLKQNPEAEFNIRKLSKDQICEFVTRGYKRYDDFVMSSDSEGEFEADTPLYFKMNMNKARKMLPVIKEFGPIHITDGNRGNYVRTDLNDKFIDVVLDCFGYIKDLWNEGYYNKKLNGLMLCYRIEKFINYYNDPEGRWMLAINDMGLRFLEWYYGE